MVEVQGPMTVNTVERHITHIVCEIKEDVISAGSRGIVTLCHSLLSCKTEIKAGLRTVSVEPSTVLLDRGEQSDVGV